MIPQNNGFVKRGYSNSEKTEMGHRKALYFLCIFSVFSFEYPTHLILLPLDSARKRVYNDRKITVLPLHTGKPTAIPFESSVILYGSQTGSKVPGFQGSGVPEPRIQGVCDRKGAKPPGRGAANAARRRAAPQARTSPCVQRKPRFPCHPVDNTCEE